MNSVLTAAALQMATTDDVSTNAARIHTAVDEATANGADLLVTPECALSGYLPPDDLDFDALDSAAKKLTRHASEAGLWLALGTTRRSENGDWLNTARLISPQGRTVGSYDKTHLMPADRRVFAPGSALPVFEAGDWTVGIQVCFDMRFPENWRILRRKGAELVLHLSNASRSAHWKLPVLEGAVRSRAAENGMFVVSANDARTPQMMVSAICDPDGRHLASAPEAEETIIYAELDRAEVKREFLAERRTDLWDTDQHRPLLLG
ncbi:MAG: carbon-nitrogen hydrolase family protein [Candidatus Brocadiia bacterium]